MMKRLRRKILNNNFPPLKGFCFEGEIWINVELLWRDSMDDLVDEFIEKFIDVYTHETLHRIIHNELGFPATKQDKINEEKIIYSLLDYEWTKEMEDIYNNIYSNK